MSEKKILPHQERVVEELQELIIKRDSLLNFLDTEVFKKMESQDQNLLIIQLETMDTYIYILTCRIDRFKELNNY